MKDTFSAYEVAKLLAAYSLSDLGTHTSQEVEENNPNSFGGAVGAASAWLAKDCEAKYYIRDIRTQTYLCTNKKFGLKEEKVRSFTAYFAAEIIRKSLLKKRNTIKILVIDNEIKVPLQK